MADIDPIQATEAVRIVGSEADGTEQAPVESTTRASDGKKALVVDATFSGGAVGTIPATSSKLRFQDFTENSGIARDTQITNSTFVDVFSYSGSGLFFGFVINLETAEKEWQLRLTVDGEEIFESSTNIGVNTEQLEKNDRYGFERDTNRPLVRALGVDFRDKTIRFDSDFPIVYTTSVVVSIRRQAGKPNKKFKAGWCKLSKET